MKKMWVKGNRIEILDGATNYFPTLMAAIDSAKSEIILFTYIYFADAIGKRVAEKLKRAAARGVSVQIILDGVGSRDLPETFIKDLRQSNIQVDVFRPFHRVFKLGRLFLKRLHQKIVVIDEKLAFVGGINIDEAQCRELDYAVSVNGPLAHRIHKYTRLFLHRFRGNWFSYFHLRRQKLRTNFEALGDVKAGFVIRDNLRHRRRIEKIYLTEIGRAKSSILIANAYFFPGYRLRQALRQASKRGVRVRLLLPGPTDHPIMRNASALLYREFLRAGIEIIEYQPKMLHAKVAVIDQRWCTVGSCNLDFFSLFLSLEANVVIDHASIAKQLEAKLEAEIAKGGLKFESPEDHTRSLWDWFVSWVSLITLRLIRFVSGV